MRNQSGLCDETTIKSLKCTIQGASRVVNTSTCWESSTPQVHRDGRSCARDPSGLHPRDLFILGVHLYPLLCSKHKSVSLSSVSQLLANY